MKTALLLILLAAFGAELCAQATQPRLEILRDNVPVAQNSTVEINMLADLRGRVLFGVRNSGNAALTLGTPTISGQRNCQVSLDTAPVATLQPSERSNFALFVTPQQQGTYEYDVTLVSNDPAAGSFTFKVRGDSLDVGIEELTEGCTTGEGGCALFLLATLAGTMLSLGLRRRVA